MLNFRLRQADVVKLDALVEALGVTRSDFIRQAVAEKVGRMDGKTVELLPSKGRGKQAPKSGGPFPDCPKNEACSFSRTTTGIQVCSTCGVKRS